MTENTPKKDDIISNYTEPVFRFCLKRISDRRESEDLAQDIMLEAVKGLYSKKAYTRLQRMVLG